MIIVNQRNVVRFFFFTLLAVSSGNNSTLDIIKKYIEEQQGFNKQTSSSFVSMGTAFLEVFLCQFPLAQYFSRLTTE